MKISCLLMGQDNLLIQCGKYLLKSKHEIKWVVSAVPAIQSWCDKNAIAWVNTLDELPVDRENLVDYLFSIVNGTLLKGSDLKIARYATINYHDSILPKYAGVNATSWAIINDEQIHGITWHIVTEGIDAGDIVYQTNFPLTENETALTLNLRCFDEASKGFIELIQKISSSSLTPIKQDLTERSYFGLTHALPSLGFIDWQTATADSIDSLSRALTFGNYSNNIGSLKLYLKDTYLLITDVEKSSEKHEHSGRVLSINDSGLLISTNTTAVLIKKMFTINGVPVAAKELMQRYNLQVNQQLPLINNAYINKNKALYSKSLAHEQFWVKQLSQVVDHEMYCDRLFTKNNHPITLEPIKINSPARDCSVYFIASILIYLFRLNNYENSTVFLNTKPTDLHSNRLPLTLALQDEMPNQSVLDEVAFTLDLFTKRGSFLNDLYLRQPSIKSTVKDCIISIDLTTEQIDIPEESLIHFSISENTKQLSIFHRLDTQYQGGTIVPLIENMTTHINNVFQSLLTNPSMLLKEIVFLTQEEKQQLFSWGVGEYLPLPSNSVTDLFEQRVNFSPEKPAIYQHNTMITYSQLWQQAEQITAFLYARNVPSQSKIGIYIQSENLMAGLILGIAKAGCIAVLLDKNIPQEQIDNLRLACTIDNEIIKQGNEISKQKNRSATEQTMIHLPSTDNQYQPLTHKNMINYAFWFNNSVDFKADSLLDLSAPLALSEKLYGLISSLLAGGTTTITSMSPRLDAKNYLTYLQNKEISHLRIATEDWQLLASNIQQTTPLNQLSHLLLTSDVETMDITDKWSSVCPKSQFIFIHHPS